MSKLLQIILCCIIIPVSLSGQGSGDTVGAIYVDDNNVKWFGSDLGLLSFDGTSWHAYNTQEETPGAVSSIMFENTASEFWVGTDDGVLLAGFDGNQFTSGSRFSNGYGWKTGMESLIMGFRIRPCWHLDPRPTPFMLLPKKKEREDCFLPH